MGKPVTAGMNETGRRAFGTRVRMYGTVATTVLILCVASPVLAKGGNGKDPAAKQQRAAAKAQQKAAKQQQHAAAKQQHAAAKQQHAVAKQQHAAAKQQRAAAKGRGAPASPRAKHGSGSAAARSVAVVASPKGKPA